MRRIFRLFPGVAVATLFSLLLSGSALAEPSVQVKVTVKGETLIIDALTQRPQPEPKVRTNRSPKFLEVALPRTVLKTKFTKVIDKGLIQKVQTLESDGTTLARVYFLSEPKAKLSAIEGGYRYTVQLNSMAATAGARPAASSQTNDKPQTRVLTNKPAGKQPVKVLTNKPAGTQPVTVLTNKPANRTVASNAPAKPSVSGDTVTKPVTLVFKNAPLTDALAELAQKAGLKAAIDPSLRGVINLSLSDIPFNEALKLLVEPLGDSVEARVSGGTVYVARTKEQPVAKAPSGPVVVEYFPFESKSVDTWLNVAQKTVPGLNYYVDSELNLLIAEGSAADIQKLSSMLRAQSKK